MADELVEMLAAEAERRVPNLKQGLKQAGASDVPDPAAVEELRTEVHGLKGAALVIGQAHLGRLAECAERLLADRTSEGTIDPDLAERLSKAVAAFEDGAKAAAAGEPEPPSVATALAELP